jgi:hypothetical protein
METNKSSRGVKVLRNGIRGAYWFLGFTIKCLLASFKAAEILGSVILKRIKTGSPTMTQETTSPAASGQSDSTGQIVTAPTQLSDFEPADRIITIRLTPAIAVIHLYVFNEKKAIKREMIVIEPRLRGLMEGRRHTLPTLPYDPVKGFADIKDQTVAEAQALINHKGNIKVKAMPAKAPDVPSKQLVNKKAEAKAQPPAKPAAAAAEKQVEAPKQAPMPQQMQAPVPSEKGQHFKRFVPDQNVGVTFDGVLVSKGNQTRHPKGREPYEVFECRLRVDGGIEVPLSGIELERELDRHNVQIGERISITPTARVPVTLGGGRQGVKNVFRVERH